MSYFKGAPLTVLCRLEPLVLLGVGRGVRMRRCDPLWRRCPLPTPLLVPSARYTGRASVERAACALSEPRRSAFLPRAAADRPFTAGTLTSTYPSTCENTGKSKVIVLYKKYSHTVGLSAFYFRLTHRRSPVYLTSTPHNCWVCRRTAAWLGRKTPRITSSLYSKVDR